MRTKLACAASAGQAMTLPTPRVHPTQPKCGGLLAIPCRGRAQGKSFPAGRAGWAREDTPSSLTQNDFSANGRAGLGPEFIYSLRFPVRQGKSRPPLARRSPTAARPRALDRNSRRRFRAQLGAG
jgi:hypothetical protein